MDTSTVNLISHIASTLFNNNSAGMLARFFSVTVHHVALSRKQDVDESSTDFSLKFKSDIERPTDLLRNLLYRLL